MDKAVALKADAKSVPENVKKADLRRLFCFRYWAALV
jgi:hypothetical protein